MQSILFVCLGNICRSPLAHGYAREYIAKNNLDIKVDSAALSHYHNGEPPCRVSLNLAKKHGITLSGIYSQHISEFRAESYDLIVAMDSSNKEELNSLGFSRVKKLGDFGFDGKDVADLYYEPHKEDEVWEMISSGVESIILYLQGRGE